MKTSLQCKAGLYSFPTDFLNWETETISAIKESKAKVHRSCLIKKLYLGFSILLFYPHREGTYIIEKKVFL